uniref:Uncharacterized protein n=1 Tax=Fagus sylvatica TaxID=28930 RepID=A0A2N9H275_FAGSY
MLIFIVANCYFVFQGVILTIVGHGAQNLKPSSQLVDGNFSASKMSRVITDICIKLCNGANSFRAVHQRYRNRESWAEEEEEEAEAAEEAEQKKKQKKQSRSSRRSRAEEEAEEAEQKQKKQ